MKSLNLVQLFATPWTVTHHSPLFMGFSRQEYWSGFAISFSRGSSQPRDRTQVSCIVGRCFTVWATREVLVWATKLRATIVWTQVNSREGTQLHPSTENWINDLLSMAPPIRTRPSFHLNQSLPLGSFHKPLIILHQRAETENHNHRKLNNLIIWTTALSNSIKLWAMPCRNTQDRRVMVESSDNLWSTGEGNGKPLQYSCLENPMNTMKRQKDRTLKDELPRSVGAQFATGDQWRNNSRKNEET